MPVPISPLALEMVRRTMRCLRSSVRSTALAAISAVFTIGYVAKLIGEDEDWLHELSVSMFPEDGWLHVYGVGDDGVTAFTQYGIECLKQIVADERAAGRAPKPSPSTQ